MPNRKAVNKPSLKFALIGAIIYFLGIILISFNVFRIQDSTIGTVILISLLYVGGLGFGYSIAGDAKNITVRILGTAMIPLLFLLPGFLVIVLLAWVISN